MSKGIKLSPKHGVNPCIPRCFWCGKEKNQIAFLGRIDREDSEAPMSAVLDYEPCDECKVAQSQGVTLIEAVYSIPDSEKRPPISRDENGRLVYPTGRYAVMKREAFQRLFGSAPAEASRVCVDTEIMDKMFEAQKS